MSRPILSFIVILMLGCQQSKTETPTDVVEKTVANPVAAVKRPRPVIDTFIVGDNRDTLFMQFDTVKKSAVFRYKGEPILLQSQPTGSGIKYTNADFEYNEWQGESTLKKNGNVIFSNK